LDFRSVIIANAASVMPMEKEPVLPMKILPRKLKAESSSQTINGAYKRTAYCPEIIIRPIKAIAGGIVSKPFRPPSWLTVFVATVTSSGIIKK